MRIGIDFDNTIACYDGVFQTAALERGLVPAALPSDKTSVRDHLRRAGRERDWTELQGYVYGSRMDLVACYPGFLDFARHAANAGHELFVISHKTRHPYAGERHDLHAAATAFLQDQMIVGVPGAPVGRVFFEPTLEQKLARIAAQACDVFIDDLPEFLAHEAFPAGTRALLFDPERHYAGAWQGRTFEFCASWREVEDAVLGRGGA
jgi:hypothetical protein